MNKILMALIALIATSGLTVFAKDAAAGGDKPKHERKTFEHLDADKDGKLTLEEFKAGVPASKSAEDVAAYFKKKDTDANGSLSKEEYEKHSEHKKDGAAAPK